MTVLRSESSYLASGILCILRIELIKLSDSRHLSTYELINNSYCLTVLSVIYVKSEFLKSTMDVEHPSYGTSPPITKLSENLRSIPSAVSGYLPRIIPYLQPVDSSS